MALELEVSKIKNTVTFQVDKNSLASAKRVVDEFSKMKATVAPVFHTAAAKKQIQELELEFKRLQALSNMLITPKTTPQKPNNDSSGNGNRGGNNNPVGRPRNQERIDRIADNRLQAFGYEASRSNISRYVDSDVIAGARQQVDAIVNDFRKGTISVQQMNEQVRQQLTLLRDTSKAERDRMNIAARRSRQDMADMVRNGRQRQREQDRQLRAEERITREIQRQRELRNSRLSGGLLSGSGGMIAGALGIGAATMGASAIFGNLRDTADRVNLTTQGAANVQSDPNLLMAITAWGQANGVDSANIKKQIDNAKDVRERLASSVMSAQLNKKGQWAGGDSGVDQIMNTFGWNPQQLQQFQSRPMDFVQATVNEGQRRGLSDAQIGHLLENLGDDMMHYVTAYKNGGQGIQEFVQLIHDTGAEMDDNVRDAAQRFTRLNTTIDLVAQGFSNNFLEGFMNTLDVSMKNSQETFANIQKAGMWLGGQFGDLANQLSKFTVEIIEDAQKISNWVDKITHYNDQRELGQGGNVQVGTALAPQVDQTQVFESTHSGLVGWFENLLNNASIGSGQVYDRRDYAQASQFLSPVGYQNPLQNLQFTVTPVLNIPDNAFNVNITPDSNGLTSLFNAQVTSSFQSLTLDANSSTTSITN